MGKNSILLLYLQGNLQLLVEWSASEGHGLVETRSAHEVVEALSRNVHHSTRVIPDCTGTWKLNFSLLRSTACLLNKKIISHLLITTLCLPNPCAEANESVWRGECLFQQHSQAGWWWYGTKTMPVIFSGFKEPSWGLSLYFSAFLSKICPK